MTDIQLTVRLPFQTGLPRDVAENVFHFSGTGTLEEMGDYWGPKLVSFYNDIHDPGLQRIAGQLANEIDRPHCEIVGRTIDFSTGAVSIPVRVEPFTLVGAITTSADFPMEVALCLSYRAERVLLTTPQARLRGRLYIGPFNNGVAGSGSPGRPTAALRNVLAGAGLALAQAGTEALDSTGTPTTGNWVCYSRAGRFANPIVNGWVDDEWDTQRRRGEDATTRTVWG